MKKILIVDDDSKTVFAMSATLKAQGYNTIGATNGKEGIKILKEQKDIDLILMDMMMPVMDGHEAINEIKKIPGKKNIPIIVLTAGGDEYKDKAFQIGANAALTKPIDVDFLFKLIKRFLE